jgi:3-oxoacyl-[acyl-carrier-protein] synthase II
MEVCVPRKRVVVTGYGCISPLGNNVESTWEGIIAGKSGAAPITLFDASEFKTQFAAEVKDFDPVEAVGARMARRMDRFTQFGVVASKQAIANAQLEITDDNRDRIGVVIGTGIGGVASLVAETQRYMEVGPRRVSPHLVPMMLPDTAAGYIAIEFGLRGPNMAIVTACASSANAIGEASAMIRRGAADVMLAGGAEAAIVPVAVAGFNVMDAISSRNDDPEAASRPFDRDRDGFVVGEGSAVLILESLEHARSRQATIVGEILGYGANNDAYHITAPSESGEGAVICMQIALKNAGIRTQDIDYINAHGTSTQLNDVSETQAIKSLFGEQAYKVPISSTKSMTGHLMGAAGALEALFCLKSIQTGIVPPTINHHNPDPECDLDYVPNQARQIPVRTAMSNSFGFGGHNACLILREYSDNGKPS